MTDKSDIETGETLNYKLLFAQRQARKVRALKEALGVLSVPDISSEDDNIKPVSSRRIKGEVAKLSFDPDNETSCVTSSRKPPLSSSLPNLKPVKREPPEISQSSTILSTVAPDKRRFFRPLADAITASSADHLGKILLRLCVEYPDARAVVESLLAETISASPPGLIRKTSAPKAPQDSSPVNKVITTPLPPTGKQNGRLEAEEQRSLAVAKSAKQVPQIQPKPSSARIPVAASEKRKWEESPGTSVISQKNSRPYYVIPKRSKLDGPSSGQKDVIPPPTSSKSLNTSEGSKPKTEKPSLGRPSKPKSFKTSRESLSDSDGGLPSGQYTCEVTDCGRSFTFSSSLNRHMKAVHKSNGEPFGCSLCPKKFAIRGYVYKHLYANHTSDDSKCIACGLAYRDGDVLNAHMRSEHGVRDSEKSVESG